MTQVSANPITQVIIFHDGARKFITESQSALIFQGSAGTNKSITTPQLGLITFSSIARIISLNDFYEQFPDERPETRPEFKVESVGEYRTLEQQGLSSARNTKAMIKGIDLFISQAKARGEDPKNAMAIRDRWASFKQPLKQFQGEEISY